MKASGLTRRLAVCALIAGAALTVSGGARPTSAAAASRSGPTLPSQDPFYKPPADLASLAPGTVIRQRTVNVAEEGDSTPISATQVLYRTTGELDQPTATVATIIRPTTAAEVTRVVSYQTAYDALGSQCDPSYTLQGGNPSYSTAEEEEQIILAYVDAGDTVVVPDYEGEKLDWAAGQESGYGTLDGIRAAESSLRLPAASTPVGLVGYSGGSIATDFAAELASKYAPKLDIVGIAEGGVPVDFLHNLSYINGSSDWSGVIPAVLVSLARAFHVSFTKYLSPYGRKVTKQVRDECINSFVGDYPGLTIQKLLKPQYADYLHNRSLVRIADDLIMSRIGTPRAPMFIGVGDADGTGDGVMITDDVEALAHTYCTRGVSVQFNVYEDDDHDEAAVPFEAGAFSFLSDRLSGVAVQNRCSSISRGNSLAPTTVPKNSDPIVLEVKNLGVRRAVHGLELRIHTSYGSFTEMTLTLLRGRRSLTSVTLPKINTKRQTIVLRVNSKAPTAGRYKLRETDEDQLVATKKLTVR